MVKEDEHYKQQVDNANAQYKLQQQQAAQAYANQLADAAQAYADQQAAAQQAYQNQLADAQSQEAKQLAALDAAHAAEMAKLQQQEADKLKQLDDAYKKQTDDLKKNFLQVMQKMFHDAGVYILDNNASMEAGGEADLAAFKKWILANEVNPPTTAPNTAPNTPPPNSSNEMFHSGGSEGNFGSASIAGALASRESFFGYGGQNLNMTINGRSLTLREVRFEIDNALDSKLSELIPAFGS